jgi:hypothetical protein
LYFGLPIHCGVHNELQSTFFFFCHAPS